MDRTYAQALLEMLRGKALPEQEELFGRFVAYVKSRGHERLLPKIMRRLEAARSAAKSEFIVEVGRTNEIEKYKEEIKRLSKEYFSIEPTSPVVNESLVGGYRITGKSGRVDQTYRRKLLTLFENILNTHA